MRTPLLLMPTMSRRTLPIFRLLQRLVVPVAAPDIRITRHETKGGSGAVLRLVVFERRSPAESRPALIWLHGGGYVCGVPEQDTAFLTRILADLDILIVGVDYRLAPEHSFPAALDDAHAALTWLVDRAPDLGIDPGRVALGGQSAGGGLAAALAQRAADHGPIDPIFQLLVYPMLDAATVSRHEGAGVGRFVWTPASNRFAWGSYLDAGVDIGTQPYGSASTRKDLTRLPPAWIGVGTLDLFHDEDLEMAGRLKAAGVPCTTYIVDGAYHGFDALRPGATSSRQFHKEIVDVLANALAVFERGSLATDD